MVDYVKMAKNIADERKQKESDAAKEAKKKQDERRRLVTGLRKLLLKELKQWDGVGQFTVKDLGDKDWVDCVQIDRRGDRCVGFKVCWDSWESEWSDDCKTTDSGQVIHVTFYEEPRSTWGNRELPQDVFRYGSNQHIVEECMKRLAGYLSKFL
jgi:hypothetical protein